ncbi:MAG: hypothetical protein JWQ43_2407 [Glaciihabitans sp.]|nr:hypothetical protein [Glaciihabitans sp.]
MSLDDVHGWSEGRLVPLSELRGDSAPIVVADSWLVSGGKTLALLLHRTRFLDAVANVADAPADGEAFWDAAVSALPRTGDWFPRIELRGSDSGPRFVLRLRAAPARGDSVVIATSPDGDPREQPLVKGPDLQRMAHLREVVAPLGAGEAAILTAEGYVVEGAYSGLLWWRGNILCGPLGVFDRVDSVTVRSVLGLATALGVETFEEAVTPAELDGCELWALSALHGSRIVTRWIDGPALAELPGRLGTWRARLAALRQPL